MKAISAVLVAFGATLALIAAIPIIMAPSAAGDAGQRAPLACSTGQLVVADRTNPTTAFLVGPTGSTMVAVNETKSLSAGNLYANGVLLGPAPVAQGATASYSLEGEGPWLIEARDGEVSVCVVLAEPTTTTTTTPTTTSTSTTSIETTTTTEPITTTTVPVTSSSVPPTTASVPPTTPTTTTTTTDSVPPTTRTPTPEPICTFVGFDIPNVGEWRLTLNDEPVTPTDQGDVLFVAANHGDTLGWVFVNGDVVLSGTLVHDCGEESG